MRFIVTDEGVYIAVQHIVSLRKSEGSGCVIQCASLTFHTETPLKTLLQMCKAAGLEVPE